MFDMFKARWSQRGCWLALIIVFAILALMIDGAILAACVWVLLPLELMSSMLWIALVEVAFLSFILIILGLLELCWLRTYLQYNEHA